MQKKGMELEGLVKSGDVVLRASPEERTRYVCCLCCLSTGSTAIFSWRRCTWNTGSGERPSRRDATFVKRLCEKRGVCCRIYPVDVPAYAKGHGLGVEEAARKLRYECFKEAAGDYGGRPVKIALAHHADDNGGDPCCSG